MTSVHLIKFLDLHPSVELEIITKSSVPEKNFSHVTLKCIAKAPVDNFRLYDPVLLSPKTIYFFFNEHILQTQNCPHGGQTSEKICDLTIPEFDAKNVGKYSCFARNAYDCTVMGVDLAKSGCMSKFI